MRKRSLVVAGASVCLAFAAAHGQSSFHQLSALPGSQSPPTAQPFYRADAAAGFSRPDVVSQPIGVAVNNQRVPASRPLATGVPDPFAGRLAVGANCGLPCAPAPGPYDCGGQLACGPGPIAPGRWFGGVFGLVMTRDRDQDIFVGYDDAYPTTQRLTTRDAAMDYSGGVEAHLGRYLKNCWAVEAVYWGIYPSQQIAQLFATDVAGNVDSPFDFDYLEYDNGTGAAPAGSYFDDTQVLRVIRDYEFYNLEINFWRCPLVWQTKACRPVRVGLLGGVRYLRIGESFDLDSDVANNAFGDDLANELFYDMSVKNDLVGFQIGGLLSYCLTNRLSLQAGPKAGIYGNHIRHRQTLWGGNGNAVISPTSPLGYAGSAYGSRSTKDDVAFIGELLVGVNYCLTPCWSLAGGYRAVFVSGVALPTGQIPYRFDDLASVDRINSSDSLVLHGAYAGAQYNW